MVTRRHHPPPRLPRLHRVHADDAVHPAGFTALLVPTSRARQHVLLNRPVVIVHLGEVLIGNETPRAQRVLRGEQRDLDPDPGD